MKNKLNNICQTVKKRILGEKGKTVKYSQEMWSCSSPNWMYGYSIEKIWNETWEKTFFNEEEEKKYDLELLKQEYMTHGETDQVHFSKMVRDSIVSLDWLYPDFSEKWYDIIISTENGGIF